MKIDIIKLKKTMAEHKVYNAWQYVQSLLETLKYMSISYEMLLKVHEHRKNTLKEIQNDVLSEAFENGWWI